MVCLKVVCQNVEPWATHAHMRLSTSTTAICESPPCAVHKSRHCQGLTILKIVRKAAVAAVVRFTLDHSALTTYKQQSLTYVSEATGLAFGGSFTLQHGTEQLAQV